MPGDPSKSLVALAVVFSIGPIAGTSSPTFIPVLECDENDWPNAVNLFEEVTNFSSPTNAAGRTTKESTPALVDPGKVKVSGNAIFSDEGQAAMLAARDSGELHIFKIQLPKNPKVGETTSGASSVFLAFVESFAPSGIKIGKVIKFDANLMVQGSPDVTLGS